MDSRTPSQNESGFSGCPDENKDWNVNTIASCMEESGFILLLGSGLVPESSFRDSRWLINKLIDQYGLKKNYNSLEEACGDVLGKGIKVEELFKYVKELFSDEGSQKKAFRADSYHVLTDIANSFLSHWGSDTKRKIDVFDSTITCEFLSVVRNRDEMGDRYCSHFYPDQENKKNSSFNVYCLNGGNASGTLPFVSDASGTEEWIKHILSSSGANVPLIVLGDDFYFKSIVKAFSEAVREKKKKIIEVNPYSQYSFNDSIGISISPSLFLQEVARKLYKNGLESLKKYDDYGIPISLDDKIIKVFEGRKEGALLLKGDMFSGKTLAVQRLKDKIESLKEYKHIEIKKYGIKEDDIQLYKSALNEKTLLEGTNYQIRWVTEGPAIKRIGIKEKIKNWLSSPASSNVVEDNMKIDSVESRLTPKDVSDLFNYFKEKVIGNGKDIDEKKKEYYIRLATFGRPVEDKSNPGIFIPQLLEEILKKHLDKNEKQLEELSEMEKEREKFFLETFGLPLAGTIGLTAAAWDAAEKFFNPLALAPYFGLAGVVLVGVSSMLNLYSGKKELGFSRYIKLYEDWNVFSDAKKRIMCNNLDENHNLPPGSSYEFLSSWLSRRSSDDEKSKELFRKNLEVLFTDQFVENLKSFVDQFPELKTKVEGLENRINKIERTLEQIKSESNMISTVDTFLSILSLPVNTLSNTLPTHSLEDKSGEIVKELTGKDKVSKIALVGPSGSGKTILLTYVVSRLLKESVEENPYSVFYGPPPPSNNSQSNNIYVFDNLQSSDKNCERFADSAYPVVLTSTIENWRDLKREYSGFSNYTEINISEGSTRLYNEGELVDIFKFIAGHNFEYDEDALREFVRKSHNSVIYVVLVARRFVKDKKRFDAESVAVLPDDYLGYIKGVLDRLSFSKQLLLYSLKKAKKHRLHKYIIESLFQKVVGNYNTGQSVRELIKDLVEDQIVYYDGYNNFLALTHDAWSHPVLEEIEGDYDTVEQTNEALESAFSGSKDHLISGAMSENSRYWLALTVLENYPSYSKELLKEGIEHIKKDPKNKPGIGKLIDLAVLFLTDNELQNYLSTSVNDLDMALLNNSPRLAILFGEYKKPSLTDAVAISEINFQLGNAYWDLSHIENTKDNLHKAIASYNEALKVYTLEQYPKYYADTQNNIGTAYRGLSHIEDMKDNLHKAIASYNEALKIYTFEQYPLYYAMTQNNIGIAYSDLSHIEKTKANLHKAIASFNEALKIYTFEQYPQDYARTKNNIGTTYRDLSHIEKTKANLHKAIASFNEALKIYTFEQYPLYYAMTQNNIGIAYSDLSHIEKMKANLHKAIASFNEALKIYTFEQYPQDYAMTQNNIGIAYSDLSHIEKMKANLHKAIASFNEALRVRTLEQHPQDYAWTQYSVGLVYWSLSHIENSNNNANLALSSL
ncbi:MAG: tetratricopeptide repeat protein, partial [Candidatus Parvarchaeota archaeon]